MIFIDFSTFGFALFLAMVLSWLVSQGLKLFTSPKKSLKNLFYMSGNGPSSHVAPLVAIVLMLFFRDGFSPLFVISFALFAIVLRDSIGIRFASGNNADVLKESLKGKKLAHKVVVEHGHTVKELIAGCLIGACVALGFIVFLV